MQRPNILFIMADQWRHDHLGVADWPGIKTPNLDRLAERGVRFTQCTTPSPVCAAARIALATGQHGDHTGAFANGCFLPKHATTYYQRLRDADYRVGVVGKLDLAKPDAHNGLDGQRPSVFRWGFTHPLECEGKMHAGRGRPPHGPYSNWLDQRGLLDVFVNDYERRRSGGYSVTCEDSVLPTDAFEDVFIGQQSVKWLQDRPADRPWHLFVSFVGPHDPFDPPTEYADRYRDADTVPAIADTNDRRPGPVTQRQQPYDDEVVAKTRRQYLAAIELIDDQIGEILAAVEARGELDNTYIVFSSDHGEMLGDLGLYTKGVPYEGALRVPLLVAGPDIEGGRTSEAMVEMSDLNPTICTWAGLPLQEDIDARCFDTVVRGKADEHRTEAYAVYENFRLVRTRSHKLVQWMSQGSELFDLTADPTEQVNLAGDSELRRELSHRLRARRFTEAAWNF